MKIKDILFIFIEFMLINIILNYKGLRKSKNGTIENTLTRLRTYKVSGTGRNKQDGIDTYTGVISVFPENKLIGIIYKNGKAHEIKNVRNNEYVLYDTTDTIKKSSFMCDTEELLQHKALSKQKLPKSVMQDAWDLP